MKKFEIRYMYEGELGIDFCYGSTNQEAVSEFYYYNMDEAVILTIVEV